MKHWVLVLLILISEQSFAQVISGRILEASTNIPIPRASIYIEGSFRTAISDSSGYFSLNTGVSNQVPIIVSCVGYSSLSVTGYRPTLEVKLEPKTYRLGEVIITDDGMSYAEKLSIFKMEFLGTSPAALNCTIENEDDLVFRYDRNKKSLEAISVQPLIVYNRDLGYRVNYFLDKFVVVKGTTALNGRGKFEQNVKDNADDSLFIGNNRRDTYLASRMYFIRCVWNNTLEKNNFRIYEPSGRRIFANDLIVSKDGAKYLRIPFKIRIVRKGIESTLYAQNRLALSYIDKNGYYDANELVWSGAMASQRVGDLLPFEY
ncbi:carboxypeptidase-like regulatory domain-containing protein [Daejeonella lutea]|uniref:CarboxypepD_reg-like domain-containing protein n=1 Tax=Daejeonella lutea TaxID=572036 RepID=A0A1T5B846_9SPHI|nr:carboxypeptidase-like regulatory domain-containing protein [Daejeonella lutea]SKB43396.1 CarboxypepD_reg-like domain-containing protein [Daejeonella lutea]